MGPKHQVAFEAIKSIVVSHDCLTTIDHLDSEGKIFVTTDTSDFHSGAVLSFGKDWESVHPVAFDSMTFEGAELNYPVHEKEMLAIIRVLKKWWADLFGSAFTIFTDHKTLEKFDSQHDLSCQQARWMEFMLQFDAKIVYIKGDDNSVADVLSCLPTMTIPDTSTALTTACAPYEFCPYDDELASVNVVLPALQVSPWRSAHCLAYSSVPDCDSIAATLKIAANPELKKSLTEGYC